LGDPLIPHHWGFLRNLHVKYDGLPKECAFSQNAPVVLKPGPIHTQLKLFGLIPIHNMLVNVVNPPQVMVCGHSIGVFLNSEGVLVVGHTAVVDQRGNRCAPAEVAGILPGDFIIKINNVTLQNEKQLRDEIDRNGQKGKPVTLEIKRKKKRFSLKVNPVFCQETHRYRVGLFIRDNAAGMGTLTFYDIKTKQYGALGHVVTDINSPAKLDLIEGKITNAVVRDICSGYKGRPGEKIGVFPEKNKFMGNIDNNTPYGIFGILQQPPGNYFYSHPLPVALAYEIETGPAEILTVLKGEHIEKFAIAIEKVSPQIKPEGKGLVIRVTDKDLIRRAGGIVQGMSGSPIIQKGKFVGVVTHVFVNDPTRGYGSPAEWMLSEAGFFTVHNQKKFIS